MMHLDEVFPYTAVLCSEIEAANGAVRAIIFNTLTTRFRITLVNIHKFLLRF